MRDENTNPAPCGIDCACCPLVDTCATYQEFLNHLAAREYGMEDCVCNGVYSYTPPAS